MKNVLEITDEIRYNIVKQIMRGDFMTEWKNIAEYDGIYQVSNNGQIRNSKGLVMSQKSSKDGYIRISLRKNGKYKSEYVHILVANAFVEKPCGENLEVNHIDGNKANNNAVNLEWVTKSENAKHAIKTGLRKPSPMMGITGAKNPNSKEILQYSLDGKYLNTWCGIAEASRKIGCSNGSISGCLTGRKRTAKGYIWRYKTSSNTPMTISVPKRIYPSGRTWKQKRKRNMHKIQQLTINGELVKTWKNYIELTEKTGFDNGNIYKCINGKIKTAYGYIWRYEELINPFTSIE